MQMYQWTKASGKQRMNCSKHNIRASQTFPQIILQVFKQIISLFGKLKLIVRLVPFERKR